MLRKAEPVIRHEFKGPEGESEVIHLRRPSPFAIADVRAKIQHATAAYLSTEMYKQSGPARGETLTTEQIVREIRANGLDWLTPERQKEIASLWGEDSPVMTPEEELVVFNRWLDAGLPELLKLVESHEPSGLTGEDARKALEFDIRYHGELRTLRGIAFFQVGAHDQKPVDGASGDGSAPAVDPVAVGDTG